MTSILEGLNAHVFDLRANRSSSRGFTLIELMIVVAIVAILAAIAYPSYAEYVRKSRRAQAKADLMEYGQLAERWHTVQNTYVGYTLPGGATVAFSPREGGTSAYRIDLSQVTQGAFMLTATALNAQAADKCGNLTLDQANRKGNSRGTKSDCW